MQVYRIRSQLPAQRCKVALLMLRYIRKGTFEEVRRRTADLAWDVALVKIVGLVVARGVIGGLKLPVKS